MSPVPRGRQKRRFHCLTIVAGFYAISSLFRFYWSERGGAGASYKDVKPTETLDPAEGKSSGNERDPQNASIGSRNGIYFQSHSIGNLGIAPMNFGGTDELKKLFSGPGIEDHSNRGTPTAACEWVVRRYSEHFPHAMQQLYRCFSWWMAHPGKEYYLISNQTLKTPFMKGMILSLKDIFNVTVVAHPINSLRVVRPNLEDDVPFKVRSTDDLKYLRDRTLEFYNISLEKGCCSHNNNRQSRHAPRIGILNRKSGRRILMVESLQQNISQVLGVPVSVYYFESRPYLEQVQLISQTDILISPHGAQLTALPFMPDCGSVIEIFPIGYYIPKYFGSLAAASGIRYYPLYTGKNHTAEDMTKTIASQVKARQQPIVVDFTILINGLKMVVKTEWDRCCS